MKRTLASAICVITAVALAACGSTKPSTSQPQASPSPTASAPPLLAGNAGTAATALGNELLKQSTSSASTSPLKFEAGQAACTARRVVSAVGASKLRTYGLLDGKYQATSKTLDDVTMSGADATSVVNAFIDCLGADTFARYLANAVTSSIPEGTNSATQRACLQNKLTATALKPMLISTLSGNKQAATQFYAGLIDCAKK